MYNKCNKHTKQMTKTTKNKKTICCNSKCKIQTKMSNQNANNSKTCTTNATNIPNKSQTHQNITKTICCTNTCKTQHVQKMKQTYKQITKLLKKCQKQYVVITNAKSINTFKKVYKQ